VSMREHASAHERLRHDALRVACALVTNLTRTLLTRRTLLN
jgi:hypothetical protein